MHVFLQGQIGIGKSTAIQKTLELLSEIKILNLGGVVTYKGGSSDPHVYLSPANNRSVAYKVAEFGERGIVSRFSSVFDREGAEILREPHNADLILMDELGFLESDALLFQDEVYKRIAGSISILGVLRDANVDWHRPIKDHPAVTIMRVDKDNRDCIPEILLKRFRRYIT